jgi:hypothetical protein
VGERGEETLSSSYMERRILSYPKKTPFSCRRKPLRKPVCVRPTPGSATISRRTKKRNSIRGYRSCFRKPWFENHTTYKEESKNERRTHFLIACLLVSLIVSGARRQNPPEKEECSQPGRDDQIGVTYCLLSAPA